jgi:hypothetical protein
MKIFNTYYPVIGNFWLGWKQEAIALGIALSVGLLFLILNYLFGSKITLYVFCMLFCLIPTTGIMLGVYCLITGKS